MNGTETIIVDPAKSTVEILEILKREVPSKSRPVNPTEVITGFITIPTSEYVPTDRLEHLATHWLRHQPEAIPEMMKVPRPFGRARTETVILREELKLSPERRALLERIRAVRRAIGRVSFNVGDLLREMDEENA